MSVVQAKKDSSDEHWRDQIARVMQEYEVRILIV